MHHELANADSEQRTALVEKFEAECLRLSQLYHPNIVYFVGVYFKHTDTLPSLLMELLPNTLDNALTKYPNLPAYMKNDILRDVACGLSYLHGQKKPVVHRDLNSRNVLLTDNFHAKIADFGVARVLPLEQLGRVLRLTKLPGNVLFMPPESFSDDPVYDVTLDMFSYGVLILNTVNQTWPKAKDRVADGSSILNEVQRRKEDLDAMGKDHPLNEFTVRCLQDCQLRPTALEAVKEFTHSTPPPYPNTLEMLLDIDNLRGETNQLVNQLQFLKSERDNAKMEKDSLVQQKNALDSRQQVLTDEIKLTNKILDGKIDEIRQVNEDKSMKELLVCQKTGRIETLEMEIAALKRMPNNKVSLL